MVAFRLINISVEQHFVLYYTSSVLMYYHVVVVEALMYYHVMVTEALMYYHVVVVETQM